MKILRKVCSVIIDVLIVIVFLISTVLVVANITVDKENGETANIFGYVVNSVQSESMSGTFEKGALVIGKLVDETTVIEQDDIISFYQQVGGTTIVNTHRVVDVIRTNGVALYQTQGDNKEICPIPDADWKTIHDIQSVYLFQIPVLGGFIDFLKQPLGFVLCLVLPMLAFIGWQIYKLISIYLRAKKEQMIEEVKDGVSDETKDAIIREYLAKMQSDGNDAAENAESEDAAAQKNADQNNTEV